ncbi:MAG: hypothetical protein ABSE93_19635 [Terriglobia bacterium]|jgi:hypothetical protein
MTRAILIGDNREVGRGTGKIRTVNDKSILIGFGLGTKKGIRHIGELFAVNGSAYINHTTPFSAVERPDLGEKLKIGETSGPPLPPGELLTPYVFYVPMGSRPDEVIYTENSAISGIYAHILAQSSGAQYAVATMGEFAELHWHAFRRPPIYLEPGANPDGSLKPEYLDESRWKGVSGIACGFLQRKNIRPGEHKIVYKGQDHTHFLQLQGTVLDDLLSNETDVPSVRPSISFEKILQNLRVHPGRQNPVHLYPRSRIRRALVAIFELAEVQEKDGER